MFLPGLWLPRRERQPQLTPNRAEIRAALHVHKQRDDGSPLTKPSLDDRRAQRRRRNRVARLARRFNRDG